MYLRSNYFALKDPEAFTVFCRRWGLTPIADSENAALRGFLKSDDYEGAEVSADEDELPEAGVLSPDALAEELPAHIADGHVAVIMAVDNDKMRSLWGYALAVNGRGQRQDVTLDDIYTRAGALGGSFTYAMD